MTEKQKRFADEYLIDLNATRAYKAAYPNVKKDSVAAQAASRMLRNVKVKSYIDKKLEEIQSDKTADAQEVMEYLTSVMRREKNEFIVVTCKERVSDYDENGKKRIIEKEMPEVVEIPAKLSDANKAAELLGKRYRLFVDKVESDVNQVVVFRGEDELED
ncbi:terminase small subunit [Acetobacterium wieringae]|uniref:terminase small subunit n=1 Tax=Acetobacterium wieringae TaxID=52694 RepID=UPI002B21F3C5|nr:terminase small subunit [Acetobacterium wieringae]MEA4805096.1 terminase small subunit [Acetobacterium wieringae]